MDTTMAERREDLLSHLEDGSYEQTRQFLRAKLEDDTYGYCCLGVACDRYRVLTGKGRWIGDEFRTDGGGSASLLPLEVQRFYGFRGRDGSYGEYETNSLAMDNDAGVTFREIAATMRGPNSGVFEN